MLWLQIFALVALAGYHRASGKENEHNERSTTLNSYGVRYNSFPYHYITNNKYTSAVVSHKAGPLCSGLHIADIWVLTVASCVYRNQAQDLFVISSAKNSSDRYNYLPVLDIFIQSDLFSGASSLALLRVDRPLYDVNIFNIPLLGSSEAEETSQVYTTRFLYHKDKKVINGHMSPVEAKFNLNDCTEKYESMPMNVFYCVSLVEKIPYSYGLFDLGTPLTYKYRGEYYLMGIFTAAEYPVFNNFKKYFLYQNIWPAMEFINSHTKLSF